MGKSPTTKNDFESVDLLIEDFVAAYNVPGISIAVVANDTSYRKSYGINSLDLGRELTDSTLFFSGEISELLVTTAILRLVQAQVIDLDDPIIKHLPYFYLQDSSYREITVRQILTSTSGIPSMGPALFTNLLYDSALTSTTKSIQELGLEFPPGTTYKKAPYGFDILADLIANVTSQSFEEHMKQDVLLPLGMVHSTFLLGDLNDQHLCQPHEISNLVSHKTKEVHSYYPYNREHSGSSGLHSNPSELLQWMKMILNDGRINERRFLKKDLVKEFLNPQFKIGVNQYTGLSTLIERDEERTLLITKTSSGFGFESSLILVPRYGFGIIVQANVPLPSEMPIAQIVTDYYSHRVESLDFAKIPVAVPMGQAYVDHGLDSAYAVYSRCKKENPRRYDISAEALFLLTERIRDFSVDTPEFTSEMCNMIALLEFTLSEYPNSLQGLTYLAEAYLLINDTAHFKKYLDMAIAQSDSDTSVLNHLNQIRMMANHN
ncbi:MAG: serine hydrolase domain-containing protein [Bacteroidota bacterium]